MQKLIIYTDGGARGNPGPAAIGAVFYNRDNKIIKKISQTIGSTTNNQAEYKALIVALGAAVDLKATEVVCYLDSELVVRQLQGRYKVREEALKPLITQVLKLTSNFQSVDFVHVPREKNKLADELVNKALDDAGL